MVPLIVSVFADTKQKLPFLTTVMLGVSDFVRHYGWIVALAVVARGDLEPLGKRVHHRDADTVQAA